MFNNFITITAWLALILILSGIVQTLRKSGVQHSTMLIGQVLGAVAGLLIVVGVLARADLSVSGPISLIGCVLSIASCVLVVRSRSLSR